MRRFPFRALSASAAFSVAALTARAVCGHPAGLLSVNRYLGVTCGENGNLAWAFLIDFAEMPARAELEALDADRDGSIVPSETAAYLDTLLSRSVRSWDLSVNGAPVRPTVIARNLEVLEGQGGLSTLRVTAELASGPYQASHGLRVRLHDASYSEYPGWRELGAEDSADGRVLSSSVPLPRAPLDYSTQSQGSAAPRIDDAQFVMQCTPNPNGERTPVSAAGARTPDRALAMLVQRLRQASGTASVLGALAFACALGAGHALSPGHGKALVAAFLVGSRARIRDALTLGIIFAAVHTAMVFVVGLAALMLEKTFASATMFRVLEIVSGLLIIGLSLWQLPARLRAFRSRDQADGGHGHPHRHSFAHSHHDHPRPHGFAHEHVHEHGQAAHDHPNPASAPCTLGGLLVMGFSGGLVPCPSALVVLLAAVAIHRVALGVALLGAFSTGLALTLSALGCFFVVARDRVAHPRRRGVLAAPLVRAGLRVLPIASTIVVLVLGIVLCLAPPV